MPPKISREKMDEYLEKCGVSVETNHQPEKLAIFLRKYNGLTLLTREVRGAVRPSRAAPAQ